MGFLCVFLNAVSSTKVFIIRWHIRCEYQKRRRSQYASLWMQEYESFDADVRYGKPHKHSRNVVKCRIAISIDFIVP